MVKITLTEHALERMKKRKISYEMVEDTVSNPTFRRQSFGGRMIATRKIAGVYVEAVYAVEKDNIVVITIY